MTKTTFAYAFAPALLSTYALFATVGAAALPTPAAAQEMQTSATVVFADLDLSSEKGQKTLERRIEKTARSVCGLDNVTTGSRMASRSQRECYDQALRSTRSQVAQAIANDRKGG